MCIFNVLAPKCLLKRQMRSRRDLALPRLFWLPADIITAVEVVDLTRRTHWRCEQLGQ